MIRIRIFSVRSLAIILFLLAFIIYCYYHNSSPVENKITGHSITHEEVGFPKEEEELADEHIDVEENESEQCVTYFESAADIDTVDVYPNFEFQPGWVRSKEFWDKNFEDRYERMHNMSHRPQLKVVVVPHSHNDPGWLKTFEQYFELKTKNIINNIVSKLTQHHNMTFIWSEISFLNAWWERSHPVKQKAFKKLVREGRLEITTGGWVMPDEACTHVYSLIDQFIEGHIWVKNNLGIEPKTGWSIDPFGHGPTVPYLLDQSGLEGTIIQRIHYAWKQWLARQQIEEFYWLPGWSGTQTPAMIVHNQPFDIYSIKSTCGPHPSICLSYDFRKIPGEYSEYTAKHEEITPHNLHSKSKTLIEEYERIGSLTPHNVVLVPLGDDFRYEFAVEFDAQYNNYMKMFQYINSHKELFNADVQFGTPQDYFTIIKERQKTIPTIKGDFFVYSDIFSEGKPAYWSGYYTTRPYLKILARQFEHQLRTAEILFTLVSNYVKQSENPRLISSEKRLEKSYEQLIVARRNLGLFQHHDAITGTSKAAVMADYGTKLFTSIYHCIRMQESALATIMIPDQNMHSQNILQSESEWETYGKSVKKMIITFTDKKNVILFNPLAEARTEVITVRTNMSQIKVFDIQKKTYVPHQVAPIIDVKEDGRHVVSETTFDLVFVASLPPLSAGTFTLEVTRNRSHLCSVLCNSCRTKNSHFDIHNLKNGDIQLENSMLKLLINRNTGFLRQIYRKDMNKKNVVEMQFGAYQSAQRHSGAYLFMPDYDAPEKQILSQYANFNNLQDENIIIVYGPVSTEITTLYLPFLIHTIKIFNVDDTHLAQAVSIENIVDFEMPPKNRETELFMRLQTDIQNGDIPEFYTDQNGFQYQKRIKVEKLGIEANYYPITTMAWMQDDETRLTLITNHAQGASSYEPGRLEVMLDRRTLYDDFRGIGEGVVDNKATLFQNWLLLENISPQREKRSLDKYSFTDPQFQDELDQRGFSFSRSKHEEKIYQLPSRSAVYLSRALNYPVNAYTLDLSDVGDIEIKSHQNFVEEFPTDIHLMSLRTITDDILEQFPSSSCFMILHRQGYSCAIGEIGTSTSKFNENSKFTNLSIHNMTAMSLTGLKAQHPVAKLKDIKLDVMDVKTFKIVF